MANNNINGAIVSGKMSMSALETLWDEGVLMAPDAYETKETKVTWRGHLRDANEEYLVKKALERGILEGDAHSLDFDDVSKAMRLRENELRNSNLVIWQGGWSEMEASLAKEIFDRGARAVGFAAALNTERYPALESFARKGVSIRPDAANSTAAGTWISWYSLVEMTKCWNPGKLERALWAVREAFNVKFPSAEGKVSWQVLGRALATVGVRSPGKAAIVARAIQLGLSWSRWDLPLYREARDFLVAIMRDGKKEIDGVETVIFSSPIRKDGKEVYRAFFQGRNNMGFKAGYVIYHRLYGWYYTRCSNVDGAVQEASWVFMNRADEQIAAAS
jgi:hypothetical protein